VAKATSPPAIATRRLIGQHLTNPLRGSAGALVRRLGAVQSQDYPAAKWALGLRLESATDAGIEQAFDTGEVLRTHVLRPTWHFVHPADIRWMLALTAPRVKSLMEVYDRQLELDDKIYRRTNKVIARALRDGNHLTRQELAGVLRDARLDPGSSQRLGHMVMRAELDAVVCSGPRRGKQCTYALLDERAPEAGQPAREEALLELTTRYFATRSPATAQDFAWWSGLTVGEARTGIEAARPSLVEETIDGRRYWSDPTVDVSRLDSLHAHLLPNYDEFFIGYKDRGAITHRLGKADLVTGWQTFTNHVVTIDGQLVGGWRRRSQPNHVVVALDVRARLTGREQRALDGTAQRFARFLEIPVVLATARDGASA
jgi:hypothetical protein